jgi:starch synthase
MSKTLSILFVSSEVYPFAKESGIGDVSYSLPLALRELGHDVRVMLPKYGTISERKNRIHEINRLRDIPIKMGDTEILATVKSSSITTPRTKVQAYVVTNQKYFDDKKGVYHDPVTWKEYHDNAERFVFFNKTVIETCLLLGWFPDIIHCNDWQTAALPALIRTLYPNKFRKTRTVFTIHNFYRQGTYPLSQFEITGLDKKELTNFRHKNQFNFMKGGIHYADFVTTVSPTYAEEIAADKKYGNGLNKLLKDKGDSFKGVLNGIEKWTWDPARDEHIVKQLDDNFDEYKKENKIELQKRFGFEPDPSKPVFSMIPRIGYQKGVALIIEAAGQIFSNNINFILLGQGDSELKEQLRQVAEKYPDKFKLKFAFDEILSHQIEAGSNFFLMPSQYEPCGLNSMYSITYGTIPIVRATGGLKDIVKDFDPQSGEGNGISFEDYNVESLVGAFDRAMNYYTEGTYRKIIENGIGIDYSWGKAAEEYAEIYKSVIESI